MRKFIFNWLLFIVRLVQIKALIVPVAIYHTNHEGSHAIGESLEQYPCVAFISECLDSRFQYYNVTIRAFLDKKGVDLPGLWEGLGHSQICAKGITKWQQKITKCEATGSDIFVVALVRRELLKTKVSAHLRVFSLIRTDLLRFALSRSKEEAIALESRYPQFNRNGVNVTRHHFSISNLRQDIFDISEKVYPSQIKHVEKGILSKLPCSNMKFIFYEDFLSDHEDFTFRLYKAMASEFGPVIQVGLSKIGVHRVHSDDITAFVSNHGEVLQMFLSEPFETFGMVLKKHKLNCSLSDLLLT